MFAAGDAGDLDSFEGYLHEDVVVHAPVGLSTVGLPNEKDSWRRAKAVIPDLYHEFLELLSDGSMVAARCIVSGTLHGTLGSASAQGRHFSVDQALFAHVRDGKIDELWEIVDTASLLTQLGSTAGAAVTPRSG
jgi:predicted ester cyclase